MEISNKPKLFIVDDDAVYLKALEIQFLETNKYEVITFETGELCVTNLHLQPDIVILDYHLDGIDKNAINGLKTLDEIKKFNSEIPVIMLSCQDKIEVAVKCMQHEAFDYVVKSETDFLRLKKNNSAYTFTKKNEKTT